MRWRRYRHRVNWKYILGEILLIFVGINLAIWFNNWNTAEKSRNEKEIAIAKIKDEIHNNIRELKVARDKNERVLAAFQAYEELFDTRSTQVTASPEQIHGFQNKYPGFFHIEDSTAAGQGLYQYNGTTAINLEISELTEIAWETTRTINITQEFDYECLYQLESMYSLQRRVQQEMDKAAEALQQREIPRLINILDFLRQLAPELEQDYRQVLETIDGCR